MVVTDKKRRLAAILAADVVGYSRMMGRDEIGTLNALHRHRAEVFDPAVAAYDGRVVKLIGDGTLVEFSSVVDAVNCAVAIQTAMHESGTPDGLQIRIGINLGDVIIDGEDIYGDGVNVAARLEPLAETGGICVSSIVNESVGSRVAVTFRDGGETHVKNIERPVRVWRWSPGDAPAASAAQPTAAPRPVDAPKAARASIAVLPFNNMSGDPEQEYFSDGITEDIITDLSKVGGLIVIARNSSFAYKGQSPDIRSVGRDLGVTSVLEGSIRKAGERVRINAQLIDTTNGAHIWADRYDRMLTDIFAVQDEVTQAIVGALKVALAPAEAARIADTPTRSIEAHDLFLRAREGLLGAMRTKAVFETTLELLQRATELDPDYAEPYAGMAMMHNLDYQNHWTDNPDPLGTAERFAKLGVSRGPEVAYVHYVDAVITLWRHDLAGTRAKAKRALEISPNYAMALALLALVDVYSGDALGALPSIERAMRLEPGFNHQSMHFLGTAYLAAGRYEPAVAAFRERIRMFPSTDLSRGFLIVALGLQGEIAEGQKVLAELKSLQPKYSFAEHLARLPFADPQIPQRFQNGWDAVAKA